MKPQGHDRITNEHLKYGAKSLSNISAAICNSMVKTQLRAINSEWLSLRQGVRQGGKL